MKKHAFRSLSVSLPIQLFICTMVLMTAFSLFSVQRFHQRTMDEYTRRAEEINGFVVREYSGAMADGILGDPPDAQSVGLAEFRQGDESFEAVCARADQAMYAEKEAYHRRKGRYR